MRLINVLTEADFGGMGNEVSSRSSSGPRWRENGTMTAATEIRIGGSYTHKLHGRCIVIRKNRNGYWIQTWGGPSGDKVYTFKGIAAEDLSRSPIE
jgi:hypothetical protein